MYYFDIINSQIRDVMDLKNKGKLKDKKIIENLPQIEVVAKMIPIIEMDMLNIKDLEIPLPTPPATPPKPKEDTPPPVIEEENYDKK